MGNGSQRQNQRIRQQVAAEAARILATEGQRNYRAAKEKAALRLGISPRSGLPSNQEVEDELKRYQALYGGTARLDAVGEMRSAALRAMKFFRRFRPKLVGPVLEGTSDEHSRISLHLFCDTPDEAVAFLMEHGIRFEQETRRIRWHDGGFRDLELLVVEADDQVFELALMAGPEWRQPPPGPVDGRPQRRAGTGEVEALIEAGPGEEEWH
ncbi:MAG: hypothetical protein R3323_00935 [Wenzhouxiangellaceae bacterium]|nr:hypothetical protein [Wenzhouxiangellaceae bacterium]